jgi:hypothetical protein
VPVPALARTPAAHAAALTLGPVDRLAGYPASRRRRVSVRTAARALAANGDNGKSEGRRKGKDKREAPVDNLLADVPVLVEMVGYEPEHKSCVFAAAECNGITYRIGDHVALLSPDEAAPQWIVVCEGFYAGKDNVPRFHGRWYWTADDVRTHGCLASKLKRSRLSAYERFSTDARDQNMVESIVSHVTILSAEDFEPLHKLDPSLVDVPGLYFCSKFYSTETGDVSVLPKRAFPGDAVPEKVAKKRDALLKRLNRSPLLPFKRVEPVRTSKRKRAPGRLLPRIGSAGFDERFAFDCDLGSGSANASPSGARDEGYGAGGKRRRSAGAAEMQPRSIGGGAGLKSAP